jgi:hypothetical protein
MGFGPAWPRGGVELCSPVGGRKAVSGSPFCYHRSTEAPDGTGAPAAGPPARARVRYSPLPHSWSATPPRALGHDLDGQPIGPTTDGTHRPQVSFVRGGPESFAATVARDLAPGDSTSATSMGPGHPGPSRGVRSGLRRAPIAAPDLARSGIWFRVSGAIGSPDPAPRGGRRDPRLPASDFTAVAAELPLHSFLLPIRPRGRYPAWRFEGYLARRLPPGALPPVSSRRLRSCSLTS